MTPASTLPSATDDVHMLERCKSPELHMLMEAALGCGVLHGAPMLRDDHYRATSFDGSGAFVIKNAAGPGRMLTLHQNPSSIPRALISSN